jgi:hypothetical protein
MDGEMRRFDDAAMRSMEEALDALEKEAEGIDKWGRSTAASIPSQAVRETTQARFVVHVARFGAAAVTTLNQAAANYLEAQTQAARKAADDLAAARAAADAREREQKEAARAAQRAADDRERVSQRNARVMTRLTWAIMVATASYAVANIAQIWHQWGR